MALPPLAWCGIFLVLLFPWKFGWASYQFLPTGLPWRFAVTRPRLRLWSWRRLAVLHRSRWLMGPGNHNSFVRALVQAHGQNIPISLKSHARFGQCLDCPVVSRNYLRILIHPWRLQNKVDLYKRSAKKDVLLVSLSNLSIRPSIINPLPSTQSIKGKLFVLLSRTPQAGCFKLNVVMRRCSCPLEVLKSATIGGSLVRSKHHILASVVGPHSDEDGTYIQKTRISYLNCGMKGPVPVRTTWEQTRQIFSKHPSNEKLERCKEHYTL